MGPDGATAEGGCSTSGGRSSGLAGTTIEEGPSPEEFVAADGACAATAKRGWVSSCCRTSEFVAKGASAIFSGAAAGDRVVGLELSLIHISEPTRPY